ncbi:hypothetical protein [Bifidobacterium simiiventris]|uniref:hypothetical protein n=1 Tax=Bifidobacterium simiiventris TaxID=2834434 RepID=UPI001C574EBD|nr:hypothetical protein [Bifidobacterium simiiventris]MBW3077694.1 hypothetical protein [Bifidobacterium simiiventris]
MMREYSYNGSTFLYHPGNEPKGAVEVAHASVTANRIGFASNAMRDEEPDLPSDKPARRSVRTKSR